MKTEKNAAAKTEIPNDKKENEALKTAKDKNANTDQQYEIKNDGQAGLTGEAVDKQDHSKNVR